MDPAFTKTIALAALLATTALGACSAKVTDDTPTPTVQEKQIEGPKLDGLWASACNPDLLTNGSVKITMVIKDHQVSRTTEKFRDYDCQTRVEISSYSGRFLFQEKYDKDIYKVEYRFDLGRGVTQILGENLRLDGKTLWISEFRTGEHVSPFTSLTRAEEAP